MPGLLVRHAHARPPRCQRAARLLRADAPRDAHLDGLLGVRAHLLAGLAKPGLRARGHDRHHVLERLARLRGHFQGVLIDLPEQFIVRAVHDLLEIGERILGADGQLHRDGRRRRLCRAADEPPVQVRPLIAQRVLPGNIRAEGVPVALRPAHRRVQGVIVVPQPRDGTGHLHGFGILFTERRVGLVKSSLEGNDLSFRPLDLRGERPGDVAGPFGLGPVSGKLPLGFLETPYELLGLFPLGEQGGPDLADRGALHRPDGLRYLGDLPVGGTERGAETPVQIRPEAERNAEFTRHDRPCPLRRRRNRRTLPVSDCGFPSCSSR